MQIKRKKILISTILIFGVLILDQIVKILVKTNMVIGEEISIIGDKILIHFTENPGMAFGMEFGFVNGKLILSLFRIVAIGGLCYYLYRLIKSNENIIFIVCVSLIIAGASGNLIDSAFYGLLFSDSYNHVAEFLPQSGGYAGFLHGNVVDMFYCPIIKSQFPTWLPFVGGNSFIFFSPVFNVADSAITISVFIMLIFYKKIFKVDKHKL